MHPLNRRNGRGFTLIELLVVIAIIAIIAALLFPVFAQAREQARQTVCISNSRQIGLQVRMYVQDFDETTTLSFYGSSGDSDNANNYKWMDAVYPYVKSEQLFTCPSDNAPPSSSATTRTCRKPRRPTPCSARSER